jgi:hypothetical protein
MIAVAKIARWVIHAVRQLGPYAAIELLLPGGSLLAIALWLYRRNRLARQSGSTAELPRRQSRRGAALCLNRQRADLFRSSTGKPCGVVR